MKKLQISVLCALLTIGGQVYANEATDNQDAKSLPLEQLKIFAEVFSRIKKDYVEEVDDTELLEHAIQGMLSGLDPHSAYLNKDDFQELREGTEGQFGGLGMEVGMEDGFVKVIAPIDDTPAKKAGIKAGDLIVRIDGQTVKGMSLDEAIGLLRGEPGSEVLLHIVRETSDGPFEVSVERAIIKTASVKSRLLEGAYGYVRLSQFQSRAGNDVRKALDKLIKEVGEPLKGLVLDLRNNPGGVLTEAVEVSDIFLEHGLVVYTEGRNDDSRVSFEAKPGDMIKGAPLVVLVNDGSASASEIVAGALQDHSRAIIMGQKTFGKGSVQTIVNVNEQVGIKLTTARYFTPNGRSIQAEGIEPDIVLQKLELKDSEDKGVSLSEANLTGHLDNPDAHEEDAEGKNKTSLAKKDYALFEALNLLKGLSVLR